MATATAERAEPPFIVTPEKFALHQADLERRAKEREAKQELLLRCIDPHFAASCELKKPQYRYDVTAEWWHQAPPPVVKGGKSRGRMEISDDNDPTGGRLVVRKEKRAVVAQNESDAWALFCDAIQQWPSPNLPGMKRTFKRSKEPVAAELVASMLQSN